VRRLRGRSARSRPSRRFRFRFRFRFRPPNRCKRGRDNTPLGEFEGIGNRCLSIHTEPFLEHQYATGRELPRLGQLRPPERGQSSPQVRSNRTIHGLLVPMRSRRHGGLQEPKSICPRTRNAASTRVPSLTRRHRPRIWLPLKLPGVLWPVLWCAVPSLNSSGISEQVDQRPTVMHAWVGPQLVVTNGITTPQHQELDGPPARVDLTRGHRLPAG
jgi:hypothetical protein